MSVREIVPGLYSTHLRDWSVHVHYRVDAEGVTIIDTGGKGSAPQILAGLQELGRGPRDVSRILLTHGHQDHAGSAAQLATATGAPVHIHAADAAHVREGSLYPPLIPRTLLGHAILLQNPPRMVEACPVAVELAHGDVVSGMRVIHTPGHSPGHVVFLLPDQGGVLIIGDALFNLPYLAAPPLYQDLDAMWRSLRKICELEFEIACFGHGSPIRGGAARLVRKKFAPK